MATEPVTECGERDFAPCRHAQRLDELAVAQEHRVLARILVTVGRVQRERVPREIGRQRHVQYRAVRLAQLGERHGGLARAGRADQDQRYGLAVDRLLRVVEDDRLVEKFEPRPVRMQPAQGQRVAGRGGVDGRLALDLGLVHDRPAQEPRAFVGVVDDDLQGETDRLAIDPRELQQQAIGVVEPGPVIRPGTELLDVGRAESSASIAARTLSNCVRTAVRSRSL